MPSKHEGAAHVALPAGPTQILLAQSAPLEQGVPAAHFTGQGTPQSTSASSPFFTPSSQEGAAQALDTQEPLSQSPPAPQTPPSAHFRQAGPPQSTSDSSPFFAPSEHVGTGVQSPRLQYAELQSPFVMHAAPSGHTGQAGPPQSVPVSSAFVCPSSHVGAQTPATQAPPTQSSSATHPASGPQ
jgi:hypothetical protein